MPSGSQSWSRLSWRFVFWFSINNYRCWKRFRALLEDVGYSWFEHKDIEYRMDGPHGVWEAECEELQTQLSNDLIWSEVLFREFL